MSLLSMMQDVCNEVGLPEPEFCIGSTDRTVLQLLAIARRVGNDLRQFWWKQLTRQHSITLVSGTSNYALPNDFDGHVYDTHWNQDEKWMLLGPIDESDWAILQNGVVSIGIGDYFRVSGYSAAQFAISPTPDSGNAGQICVFEYQSKNWVKPQTWATSTVFGAGDYCFYNGYYFSTSLGGTAGASAPTPSSLNDGGVLWTLYTGVYDDFLADTDETNIDEALVGLGIQWNYLASKGLPYLHLKEKYESNKRSTLPKLGGAGVIDLASPEYVLNSLFPTPTDGYG